MVYLFGVKSRIERISASVVEKPTTYGVFWLRAEGE
jgi:hypothetical protein